MSSQVGTLEVSTEPDDTITPAIDRPYGPMDHISHFTGVASSVLFLVAAVATLWEVFARYVLNAPTQWAFEVTMVLIAGCWMLSSGYITLRQKHISITVISHTVSEHNQWRLSVFSHIIGIASLFLLLTNALDEAAEAIHLVERAGSAFNSPMPMILKSFLVIGCTLYLSQLTVNFHYLVRSQAARLAVKATGLVMAVYLANAVLKNVFTSAAVFETIASVFTNIASVFDIQDALELRSYGLGVISLGMVVVLVALMMTGMPLGIVTLIVSVIMAIGFFGPKGLYLVSTNAGGLLDHYTLVAIPFFVLMASILEKAGIAEDLFDAMSIFAGNLRGGVAVQTVVVAVILAAMSGVMGGEIVMLGLVALPQMLRLGYDRKLSIGLICASGALATLIPPSIVMIVYGLSAEVGIGDLFMAGFIPGFMLAAFYAIYVLVRVHINPKLAPTAAEVAAITGQEKKMSKQRLQAVFLSIALIGGVMGSIYGGIASVTEAAAVGTVGSIVVAFIRSGWRWDIVRVSLVGAMATVGTIVWLILGAVSFVGIYNLIGGADFMRSLFTGLGIPALGVILLMMAILVVLGTFMEWIAIIFITVPVFAPVVVTLAPELGLTADQAKIWFGILFVMNIQIYFLSPPFGPACFWLKSVAPKDVSLQEIFISVMPFIALQVVGLILVVAFPQIALWLPEALGN
jgi:tripartite ATP-independent transporter DctM subunit